LRTNDCTRDKNNIITSGTKSGITPVKTFNSRGKSLVNVEVIISRIPVIYLHHNHQIVSDSTALALNRFDGFQRPGYALQWAGRIHADQNCNKNFGTAATQGGTLSEMPRGW
jgi:hypothetical protein